VAQRSHVPVLLDESLRWLGVRSGGTYIDATFGAGGHSAAIAASGARVIAFDLDPAVALAGELGASVTLVRGGFDRLEAALDDLGVAAVDGVLFDLGLSSMQLGSAERGFSLQLDGPLDMRMNPGAGEPASELLSSRSENELATLFQRFGEESAARRIARAIVAARDAGRLPARTLELARLVSGVVHVRGRRERIHPATRTFQALRIAVNDELGALARGLAAAAARTRPGGRLVAISFHSLEDRIVKQTFRNDPRLAVLTKKPVGPDDAERARNPRARSAKLRAAERLP
jgi:16S rRNA (cytosine1402-N4)-methyltransferase